MQPWLSWNLQCRPCWLGTHDVDPGSLEFMEIYLPQSLDSARSWEVHGRGPHLGKYLSLHPPVAESRTARKEGGRRELNPRFSRSQTPAKKPTLCVTLIRPLHCRIEDYTHGFGENSSSPISICVTRNQISQSPELFY